MNLEPFFFFSFYKEGQKQLLQGALELFATHDHLNLLGRQRLVLEQCLGQAMMLLFVLGQQRVRLSQRLLQKSNINETKRVRRHVPQGGEADRPGRALWFRPRWVFGSRRWWAHHPQISPGPPVRRRKTKTKKNKKKKKKKKKKKETLVTDGVQHRVAQRRVALPCRSWQTWSPSLVQGGWPKEYPNGRC